MTGILTRVLGWRTLAVVFACLLSVAAALAAATYLLSGATLAKDGSALARVRLQPLAGSLAGVVATTPNGKRIQLAVAGGRLVPRTRLEPGEKVTVAVVVRRPSWSAWALGKERHERLTVRTPVADVVERWLNVPPGQRPVVRFDTPVSTVAIGRRTAVVDAASVAVPTHAAGGSVRVAAAARPWERLGSPVTVTWFPKSPRPVVLVHPSPGARIEPLTAIRLTLSKQVASAFPHGLPSLAPSVAGRWTRTDSHTLVFHPSGFGAPFATTETVRLPTPVTVAGSRSAERELSWHVAPASFLRLQQLLAEEGYLPLEWTPTRADIATTRADEVAAATSPPEGRFRWRYPNTPSELVSLWRTGHPNEITSGAVMRFEDDHRLAVDGIVGPQVWRAAIADAVAGKRLPGGYSYVYVHRNVPQLLTLWHNGSVVLTSPGNTGVPAAPTQLGTWPVFEHIPIGTMSGTNPDGSHYNDPGIRWISYFHGGEALHAFNRASFGTPQSLGCVELPLAAAAKVWPYTPIGTLVTVEN
jgi:hypothetical protein